MSDLHIMRKGRPSGPFTAAQVRAMIANRQLRPADLARPVDSGRWVRISELDWDEVAARAAQGGSPKPPGPTGAQVPGNPVGRGSWKFALGISAVILVVVAFFAVGTLVLHNTVQRTSDRGQGQPQQPTVRGHAPIRSDPGPGPGQPTVTPAESAKQALIEALDDWRAGDPSDAAKPLLTDRLVTRPLLVDYDIVRIRGSYSNFRATVNLTFSTVAGGRPVEQHHFYLAREESGWRIRNPFIH